MIAVAQKGAGRAVGRRVVDGSPEPIEAGGDQAVILKSMV